MDDLPATTVQLLHYSHGVYFSESLDPDLPVELEINGRRHQRFLDYIYIPGETEDLTGDQILAVNELRQRLLESPSAREVNGRVREIFIKAIEVANPRSLLEVGPGINPIFSSPPGDTLYWLTDISDEVIAANRARGLTCFFFNPEGVIPIPNGSIDIIVAIFVLQFHFTLEQLMELARVMKIGGVMVANVYRRSDESREMLSKMLMDVGLGVIRVVDRLNLCRSYEYWLVFKDERSPALALLLAYFG
jgi:SAM-dependent methyltransferase